MITCNLIGGLGNQMFQIAATHALALRNNDEAGFDLYKCYTPLQGNVSDKYKNNFFSKLRNVSNIKINFSYHEPSFSYNKIQYSKELVLNGYFQSERYFIDYKKEIIDLFNMEESPLVTDYLVPFKTMDIPITAIHVRRGDYLKNPDFHPVCSVEYYKKAMEKIGPSNFIFISDDMEWVKENFSGANIWYSNFTDEINDFKLMASCDNNIISNSSFSWWGAYLNRNEDKRIIAPSKWFGPKGPQDIQDIFPYNWEIID